MAIQDILARLSFDAATRIRTWKKLAMQAQYGLPLKDSLRNLRDQTRRRNPALANVFDQMLEHSDTEWQVHMRIQTPTKTLNGSDNDGWVYPADDYGRIMVLAMCIKQTETPTP